MTGLAQQSASLTFFSSHEEDITPIDSASDLAFSKSDSAPKDASPQEVMGPAPMSPLDMSKDTSKGDVSKTPKFLRFDLSPSFIDGDVPDNESEHDIETSAGSRASTRQSIHPYLSGALTYTVSVKNTFVHLDQSLIEDSDCDLELPPRSSSAPSMQTLSGASTPATECLESLASCTPQAMREHESGFPVESLEGDPDSLAVGPPHLPMALTLRQPGTPGVSSRTSGSRTHSSSSLDSSCGFRVKNTFIHVDVDVDGEDDICLPTKSVSQPDLIFVQDAPAAPSLPSVGSALHCSGQCRPCAWYWKPQSCQWGSECRHCHLCPIGELRRRKKEMQTRGKESKRAAKASAAELKGDAAACSENEGLFADQPSK